jgi:hypothetical protein
MDIRKIKKKVFFEKFNKISVILITTIPKVEMKLWEEFGELSVPCRMKIGDDATVIIYRENDDSQM